MGSRSVRIGIHSPDSMRTSCKFKERAVNLGGQGADVFGRVCQAEAQNRPYLTLRFEKGSRSGTFC
jgi:hypothetical protein